MGPGARSTKRYSGGKHPAWIALVLLALLVNSATAATVRNTANAVYNGLALDGAAATVTLTVTSTQTVDPAASTVSADPTVVIADGVAASTVRARLIDTLKAPVAGKAVQFATDRGAADQFAPTASATDGDGRIEASLRSTVPGVATVTATDGDGLTLAQRAEVYFTQGKVLDLAKLADKEEAVVGDVVTYSVVIKNLTAKDVRLIKLHDDLPPNFKYVAGSARYNGARLADPAGHRPLVFDLGSLPARVDANGNGVADPGEPGYAVLSYQLIVGAGATPRDYINTAHAFDVCNVCYLSNRAEATVTVTLDPLFDLGTIIGKVYEDANRNGWQDAGEAGVAGAMVVLDDGSYALADQHGRYHFPAVKPGPRALKINLRALAPGAETTGDEVAVVNVTPGLLAKANFGVIYRRETETIGRDAVFGLTTAARTDEKPASVVGSVETLTALINGSPLALPRSEVRLGIEGITDRVEIRDGEVTRPLRLAIEIEDVMPASWSFIVSDGEGRTVRRIGGSGTPPPVIEWDARDDQGALVAGGAIYAYQLELRDAGGGLSSSPRRLVGVDRSSAISLDLTGGAFTVGTAVLSAAAKSALDETAALLRSYPDEKVLIEGHTDATGRKETNMTLSRQRAEAAADYLVQAAGIPRERLMVRWYGSERPLASNALAEGRERNRRVEIKGLVGRADTITLTDQFRTTPAARIGGADLAVDAHGLFNTEIAPASERLDLELRNAQGASTRASIAIPRLQLSTPALRVPYGARDETEGYAVVTRAQAEEGGEDAVVMHYRLRGVTDPGNEIEIDGRAIEVAADGRFETELALRRGLNLFSVQARNAARYARLIDLRIEVVTQDEQGRLLLMAHEVPRLTVELPPEDVELRSSLLVVSGETAAANRVEVNGQAVAVQGDGHFNTTVTLPAGTSTLDIGVTDPAGNSGHIRRKVTVRDSQFFMLAFADGKLGQMRAKGYLQGAGMDTPSAYYSEGRVAYYLKGMIAGKYLVTSAFDSGTREFGELFDDIGRGENQRLLTNLDPDKLYPVYGDDSTVIYDAQSLGKFYLAIESDELNALIGNAPIALTDTELARYQRTLFGGRVTYRSLARAPDGRPDTEVMLFATEARQINVRDELRATGGSLYYLSHDRIVEGSEQVTLVVRDQHTGLTLTRRPQQPNVDYTIKYVEGRILFTRPLASVEADSRLIDRALLGGNPVTIEVVYEADTSLFESTASGGRVRRQLNDRIALGGTYVQDRYAAGQYQLQGVDTELRLGKGTRLLAELAQSSGSGGASYFSEDGGLSFTETTPADTGGGVAWKLAAETDLGAWFGRRDRYRVGAYMKQLEPGFVSVGSTAELATDKHGVNVSLDLTERDRLLVRSDRERRGGSAGDSETAATTAQLRHETGRWRATGEYQQRSSSNAAGGMLEASLIAAQLRSRVSERLTASIEQQFSLSGPADDRTTLAGEYQINSALTLQAKAMQGTLGQAAQIGAEFNLDGNRVYFAQRLARDPREQGLATTVLGAQAPLGRDGKLYSEYQWESAERDERNASLLGAERRWRVRPGLQWLLAGEVAALASAGGAGTRHSLATGLNYNDAQGITAATRNELRLEDGARELRQFLTVNDVEIKLNPDFRVLGKYRYSITRDLVKQSTEAEFEEASLGLAYRPVSHDRFNGLARYTRQNEHSPLNLTTARDAALISRDIASLEWSLQMTPQLEWVDKLAVRRKEERSGDRPAIGTTTFLSVNRLNYRIRPRIDLGTEYRLLSQRETRDQRQGWAAEIAWHAVEHVRIGGGYNFTDFSDSEFSDNDYSVQGWFLRLQGTY